MKKKVFVTVIVSLLVLSVLYVFAQAPMMGRGEGHKGKGLQMKEFDDDLDLTPEQEAKIVDIRFAHHQEILPLRRDLQKKKIELIAELDKENPNQQVLDKLSDEMNAIMGKIKKSKLHFLLSIKSVLTKEQWEEAKEDFLDRKKEDWGPRNRIRRDRRMMLQN